MKTTIAGIVGIFLNAIFFGLVFYMEGQKQTWMAMDKVLSQPQMWLISFSDFYANYWYAIAPLSIMALAGIAQAFGGSASDNPNEMGLDI